MSGFHSRTQVARDFPKYDSRDYEFQTQDLLLCHPEYTQRAQSYKITIGWVLSANSPASFPRKTNSMPPYVRMLSTGGKYKECRCTPPAGVPLPHKPPRDGRFLPFIRASPPLPQLIFSTDIWLLTRHTFLDHPLFTP